MLLQFVERASTALRALTSRTNCLPVQHASMLRRLVLGELVEEPNVVAWSEMSQKQEFSAVPRDVKVQEMSRLILDRPDHGLFLHM